MREPVNSQVRAPSLNHPISGIPDSVGYCRSTGARVLLVLLLVDLLQGLEAGFIT